MTIDLFGVLLSEMSLIKLYLFFAEYTNAKQCKDFKGNVTETPKWVFHKYSKLIIYIHTRMYNKIGKNQIRLETRN